MTSESGPSLQEKYALKSICFGCGPANDRGLRIRSFAKGEEVVAHWTPQKYHEAFPGILNGGIVGALLDCHSNWTGAWHLMKKNGMDQPPCTVTADYKIVLKRPTPTNGETELIAKIVDSTADRATVEA